MLDDAATVPGSLRHERFVAVPLTKATAGLDYASYVASPDVIRVRSDGRWPVEGFTFDEDLELVALHEADHRSRRSFAFVLLTPSETEALGCLYLNPLHDYLTRAQAPASLLATVPEPAAMVTFWLRQDQQHTGLADIVGQAVHTWILRDWPFTAHLFRVLPGEQSSRQALDRLRLPQVTFDLRGEKRRYLWYQGAP